jgi:hypothetical protein
MCTRDIHLHCQELRPIREVTENAKSSAAIVHIQRDLEDIVGTFEKLFFIYRIELGNFW